VHNSNVKGIAGRLAIASCQACSNVCLLTAKVVYYECHMPTAQLANCFPSLQYPILV